MHANYNHFQSVMYIQILNKFNAVANLSRQKILLVNRKLN